MELTAVTGHLEEGRFYPDQPLPTGKVPAVLTFVVAAAPATPPSNRPRFSFDEALALPTTPGVSLSDAVIAEREEGY